MSRPRFLADQDFNNEIVERVWRREPIIEIELARHLGAARLPDPQLLELAARNGLILPSHDRRTMSKHAYDRIRTGAIMSGLLLVSQRKAIPPVVDDIILVACASEAEEWQGQVKYLPL